MFFPKSVIRRDKSSFSYNMAKLYWYCGDERYQLTFIFFRLFMITLIFFFNCSECLWVTHLGHISPGLQNKNLGCWLLFWIIRPIEHVGVDAGLPSTVRLVRVRPVPRGSALWSQYAGGGESELWQPDDGPLPEAFGHFHWCGFHLRCERVSQITGLSLHLIKTVHTDRSGSQIQQN